MEMKIQDPTYASSMRLGEALIDACKKSVDGAGAYAFAEENGIDLFLGDPDFKKYITVNKYVLVVGTDSITDPKAISRLRAYKRLYSNLSVYGYVHDPRKNLFHPKVTWFKTATGGISLIGSGNLTERGLFHNIEMFAYDTLSSAEFNNLESTWRDWLNFSMSNNLIFDIDDPIIDYAANISASKKAKSFSTPKESSSRAKATIPTVLTDLYKKQPKAISVIKKPTASTGKATTPKPIIPKKSSRVIAKPVPTVAPVTVTPTVNPVWSVSTTDRILVAEVPKSGERWKQVNFDKSSFQNYFGATPGGTAGTYRILLKNTDSKGVLGVTEARPSVSVVSHNWRFEISAASGLTYPTGINRPYVIFSEASIRSFIYELIMPGDIRYSEVDKYVNTWKKAKGVSGLARIITDVATLKPSTPNLGLWKV